MTNAVQAPRRTLTALVVGIVGIVALSATGCCKVESDEQKCERIRAAVFDYVFRCSGSELSRKEKSEARKTYEAEYDCSEKEVQEDLTGDVRDIDKCVSDLKKASCGSDIIESMPKSCTSGSKKKKR